MYREKGGTGLRHNLRGVVFREASLASLDFRNELERRYMYMYSR